MSEKLRILEESRRRSLANIVHELGRPLGAILSAVHVLRKGRAEDPIIRDELLEGMEKEINHMQPLLDDLAQLHGHLVGDPLADGVLAAADQVDLPFGELGGQLIAYINRRNI